MGLINNFFEIRGDAFKLITHHRRCIPRSTDSIGPWLDALSFLSWLSAMINTSLVILFNTAFKKSGLLAAHGGVLVAFIAALLASHGHFVIKGVFSRLFKLAIWDNSESAAVVRDRALALHSSKAGPRKKDRPLDNDDMKLRQTINEVRGKSKKEE